MICPKQSAVKSSATSSKAKHLYIPQLKLDQAKVMVQF